ncbi:MAG TPA: hypothetical protein VEV85_14610 [Bryobacteraceae bacterium]|jgi:hypothetical protein|nr:hypothetical protein [Bryobacteraceae bacterium]
MNDFENDLRRVLRRREPPRDLSRVVMARVAPMSRPVRLPLWRPALAAAAALLILVTGFDRYREYQRGQEAKREVMLALEITAQQLALVQGKAQEKIDRLNRRSIDHDR